MVVVRIQVDNACNSLAECQAPTIGGSVGEDG